MTDSTRNAAIWYAADAFDPKSKGINGRRVAGESFLRGFFEHVDAAEFQGVVQGLNAGREFQELAAPYANGRPVRTFQSYRNTRHDGPGTIHYPAPNLKSEAWRRYHYGQKTFSISGITHTTATGTIMNAMFDLRTAPVEPWDGIICTSNAVLTQVEYQFDLFDQYAERRFGTATPVRPQTSLIPLGIHTNEFETTQKQRQDYRSELGIGPDDTVFMVLSRLSANEKFDPLPVYRALSMAQKATGATVHLILCGIFPSNTAERIFRGGAAAVMPSVKLHVVDGKDPDVRSNTFAASDVFLFLIDNIQETFGIAPIEAMAAGLPVIASDWDGLKDTVTPDVGIRIPTEMPTAPLLADESRRHQFGVDTYPHYAALVATVTVIDPEKTAQAMVHLIKNPNLRKKMGEAGRKRARSVYDWKHIIPQMQDFWAELSAIRLHDPDKGDAVYAGLEIPFSPNAGKLFASYPSQQRSLLNVRLQLISGANAESVQRLYQHRDFKGLGRQIDSVENVSQFVKTMKDAGQPLTVQTIAQESKLGPYRAERIAFLLMKYGFVKEVSAKD